MNPDATYPREGTRFIGKKGSILQTQTLQITFACLLQAVETAAARSGGQSRRAFAELRPQSDWQQIIKCGEGEGDAARILKLASKLTSTMLETGQAVGNQPLQPAFTHLNGDHPGWFLEPVPQNDQEIPWPVQGSRALTPAQYRRLLQGLETGLAEIPSDADGINGMLNLLEKWTASVPSDAPDVSLYDQTKLTAGIAAAASVALAGQHNRAEILNNDAAFRKQPLFLLYEADFSGIQKFIYTVSTSRALKSLRSRSFVLELFMMHQIDEVLTACGVSRTNLLYAGGGHCYLLLPNTEAVQAGLNRLDLLFNDWLLDQFGSRLYLASGWTPCCGNDLLNVPAEKNPYRAMFRRVSGAVARRKLHRYSAEQIRQINSVEGGTDGRECRVCGRTDYLSRDDLCPWCSLFVDLSEKIQNRPVCIVSAESQESYDFALPAGNGQAYFTFSDEKDAKARLTAASYIRIYARGAADPAPGRSIRLYVGDYCCSNEMEALAQASGGIDRLGVCRMDVDNLGQAFVAGFAQPGVKNPDQYVTLARAAAFSRQLSLFFQHWINPLLSEPAADGQPLAVAIVYSGGDDVFLVGAWNDVIEAAERIQQGLTRFSCGALTISGGIALYDAHFPIRLAADQTAELEDRAKHEPGKNAIALFDPEQAHTYSWTVFRQKVMEEKHRTLQEFFSMPGQQRGNAFLYRLLELLREAQNDRINLARYAYLLSRMEPAGNSPARAAYQKFAANMYSWALDPQDRDQLITAIYIYVYQIREGK